MSNTQSEESSFLSAYLLSDVKMRITEAHTHAQGQICGAKRGLMTFGTEAGLWVIPATHAMWIPARHAHSMRSHGPFSGWSVYLAESVCRDFPSMPCTMRTSGLLQEAVARMVQLSATSFKSVRAHLAQVILDELHLLPREQLAVLMPRDPRALRVAHLLIQQPDDPRTLAQWAATSALSVRTLSRKFVVETGYSFGEWRSRVRLLRGLEMLAENIPVTTIALELGYQNISAFIAMFRRTFGVTPTKFFEHSVTYDSTNVSG